MNRLRNQILALPKADVHNHLHLGGTQKMLLQKYPNANLDIPNFYDGLDGMVDFINNHINSLILTSDDMIFFFEMALANSINDNVTYLEASIDIGFVRFFDNAIEDLISAVRHLKESYKSRIDFRPDIGINKDHRLEEVNSIGLKCIESGVFGGIDIYGKEINRELDAFVPIFDAAKENGLKTKVHIGEFSDHKTIDKVISLFHPTEIQHGITASNSMETMNMLLENDIQLNVCPQSNICLGAVKHISEHPIRKLYDHGIKLTINTDDHLLFNATLTDQYLDLIEKQVFSFEEIENIRNNGFN
ncbi:MAG: hypothetical protein ABJN95_14925 [Maribacter sp.]|uniref:hypothetical protein n=1 Tax=Maribacter sp. TaxID=1897614 RepID=UPI003296955E